MNNIQIIEIIAESYEKTYAEHGIPEEAIPLLVEAVRSGAETMAEIKDRDIRNLQNSLLQKAHTIEELHNAEKGL